MLHNYYNNIFRRFHKLPSRLSASYMFSSNNTLNIEVLIIANVYSFRKRLANSIVLFLIHVIFYSLAFSYFLLSAVWYSGERRGT